MTDIKLDIAQAKDDLLPYIDYIYGFIISSGAIRRDKIILKQPITNSGLIMKLKNLIPNAEVLTREDPFNASGDEICLVITDEWLLDWLCELGLKFGNEPNQTPPIERYSQTQFWRGVMDGMGQSGMHTNHKPYIRLPFLNHVIRTAYAHFLYDNFRIITADSLDSVMLFEEEAVKVAMTLYAVLPEDLYLEVNKGKADDMHEWFVHS